MNTVRASGIPLFILKTQQLIQDTPNELVEWTNDGTAFIIKRPKRLEKEFLHRYFNHNNSKSFVRQLSFYGFQKSNKFLWIDNTPLRTRCVEYRHRNFIRGRFDLMRNINRKTSAAASKVAENTQDLKHDLAILMSKVDMLSSRVECQLMPPSVADPFSLTQEQLYEFIESLEF